MLSDAEYRAYLDQPKHTLNKLKSIVSKIVGNVKEDLKGKTRAEVIDHLIKFTSLDESLNIKLKSEVSLIGAIKARKPRGPNKKPKMPKEPKAPKITKKMFLGTPIINIDGPVKKPKEPKVPKLTKAGIPPKKDIQQGLKDFLAKPENAKKRQEAVTKNKVVRAKKEEAEMEKAKPKPTKIKKSTKEEKLLALKLLADKSKLTFPDELLDLVKDYVPGEDFKFTTNNDAVKETSEEIRKIIKTISKIPIAKVRNSGVEFIENPKYPNYRTIRTYTLLFKSEKAYYESKINTLMMKQYRSLNMKILNFFTSSNDKIGLYFTCIFNKKTNELYLEIPIPPIKQLTAWNYEIDTPNHTEINNNEGWPEEIVVLSNVTNFSSSRIDDIPLELFFKDKLRFKNRNEILRFILQ
jgi:hypothetical protein